MTSVWGYEGVPTLLDRRGAVAFEPRAPVVGSSGSLGAAYPMGASAKLAMERTATSLASTVSAPSYTAEEKESDEQQQQQAQATMQRPYTAPSMETMPLPPASNQSPFLRSAKLLSSTANRHEEQPAYSFHTDGEFQQTHQDHDFDHHNQPPRSFEPAWLGAGADPHRRARNSTKRTQTSTRVNRPLDYYRTSSIFPRADRATPAWRLERDEATGQLKHVEPAPLRSAEKLNLGSSQAFPNREGRRPHTALFTPKRADPPYRVRGPPPYPLQYSWYYEGTVAARPIEMVAKPVAIAPPHFSATWVPVKEEPVPQLNPYTASPDVMVQANSQTTRVKGVPTEDKKHRSVSRNGLGGFFNS